MASKGGVWVKRPNLHTRQFISKRASATELAGSRQYAEGVDDLEGTVRAGKVTRRQLRENNERDRRSIAILATATTPQSQQVLGRLQATVHGREAVLARTVGMKRTAVDPEVAVRRKQYVRDTRASWKRQFPGGKSPSGETLEQYARTVIS